MARPLIKKLMLKKFNGTTRGLDGSVIDVYEPIKEYTVELYEIDNSRNINSEQYYNDVRRELKAYIGVIRRCRLDEGKYTLQSETEVYTVNKAQISGNKTFLKLELMEGF